MYVVQYPISSGSLTKACVVVCVVVTFAWIRRNDRRKYVLISTYLSSKLDYIPPLRHMPPPEH